MEVSFVSKARTAFHSAAAKAEKVFADIKKSDSSADRGRHLISLLTFFNLLFFFFSFLLFLDSLICGLQSYTSFWNYNLFALQNLKKRKLIINQFFEFSTLVNHCYELWSEIFDAEEHSNAQLQKELTPESVNTKEDDSEVQIRCR